MVLAVDETMEEEKDALYIVALAENDTLVDLLGGQRALLIAARVGDPWFGQGERSLMQLPWIYPIHLGL